MSEPEEAAEYFARSIVRARDSAIGNFDDYFAGNTGGEYGQSINRIYNAVNENSRKVVSDLLPIIVDETIGIVLQILDEMIDTFEIKLKVGDSDVSIYEVYELLQPELTPQDGWLHKYGKERVIDI